MQKVNLNLIPGGVCPVVNVSQYDEGRQFQLAIFQGTASYDLTGKTVTIEVGKTDGNGCAYDATDTVNGVPVVAFTGNLVTITTPVQMTACAGDNKAELKISDSTAEIGTLNFILLCEQSALSPDTPISETEIPAIVDAAEANAERAEAAVEHYPYINPVNKNWMVWDAETGAFVDTGVRAEGIDGEGSVQSVNNISPDVNGDVSLPLATGFSDVLPTTNGGTGNADGYIRTGKKASTLIGTASTIEGQDNEGAGSFGHVEGKDNSIPAGVSYAHVGGVGNTAHVTGASVIGKYAANYGSYNTPLFAVGNGTAENAKSSAFHINTDGSAQVAGNLYKGTAFNTAPSNGFVSASNIADVIEPTRTMTALRAKGKHVYVVADDLTYEVTADAGIPTNGTLIPNTNAVVWTAAGGYETISSDLASKANKTWTQLADTTASSGDWRTVSCSSMASYTDEICIQVGYYATTLSMALFKSTTSAAPIVIAFNGTDNANAIMVAYSTATQIRAYIGSTIQPGTPAVKIWAR